MAWHEGPFAVVPGDHRRHRPGRGEIYQHHRRSPDAGRAPQATDRYRLRCPRCGASSWYVGELLGPPEAPTLAEPLQCGCTARCGVVFRIRHGRATAEPATDRAPAPIPEDLHAIGVRRPPPCQDER